MGSFCGSGSVINEALRMVGLRGGEDREAKPALQVPQRKGGISSGATEDAPRSPQIQQIRPPTTEGRAGADEICPQEYCSLDTSPKREIVPNTRTSMERQRR